MGSFCLLLAVLPLCLAAPDRGGYYGQTYAEPHDGFESSVNANNARRQLAVNKNAQWYGTGTGTARKDGVPGSPLGVIGVASHGHSGGGGYGHSQPSYGHGHNQGYGNGHDNGYGQGHGHNNQYGNSYHHAPSYHPYSQKHGDSHGHNHPSHYDPHGHHPRSDGPKYGYGFNYELSKHQSYH